MPDNTDIGHKERSQVSLKKNRGRMHYYQDLIRVASFNMTSYAHVFTRTYIIVTGPQLMSLMMEDRRCPVPRVADTRIYFRNSIELKPLYMTSCE